MDIFLPWFIPSWYVSGWGLHQQINHFTKRCTSHKLDIRIYVCLNECGVCGVYIMNIDVFYDTYGPRPLKSTQRHGLSLTSTCDIRLSDMRHGGKKKIVT